MTFNTLTRGAGLVTLATMVAVAVRRQARTVPAALTRWADLPPYRGHPN